MILKISYQLFYWGANITFLRKQRNLSQDALAKKLSITRVKLNAHENGKTVNPTLIDLASVSDFFEINIDTLLKIRLEELSPGELQAAMSVPEGKRNHAAMRILAITVNQDNEENVEFVPVNAKAGYRTGYKDPEYLANLPKYTFPGLPKWKTFRMFPITGDSMLPIPDGSIVLASYVTDWSLLKKDALCIVILNNEVEFVFKKVTLLKNNKLMLVSENEYYKPYEVDLEDVLEIWEFDRFISEKIPDRGTNLDELKTILTDMRRQLELR